MLLNRFLYFFFFLTTSINTQGQKFKFHSLTKESLFDKEGILCINQDQNGRIIFGGQSQLFIYDSFSITPLDIQNFVNKNSLYIQHIQPLDNNLLLIAASNKLFIYDLEKRKIYAKNNQIWQANLNVLKIEKINGQIYVLSDNGLYFFESKNNEFKITRKLKINRPTSLIKLYENRYSIANETQVYELEIENNSIKYIKSLNLPLTKNIQLTTLFPSYPTIYIGTKNNGFYEYNFESKNFTNYNQINSKLLSNNIRKITKTRDGNILIGTLRGLSVLNTTNYEFTNYKHETKDNNSISQNSIHDIFIDNQDNIWFGTYYGGLNYVSPNEHQITFFNANVNNKSILDTEIISSVAESKNYIWIGTEEEGIKQLNKETNEIKDFTNLTQSTLVKDVFVKNEKLYIAQIDGKFDIYDINNQKIEHYNTDSYTNKYTEIIRIFVDDNDNIYLSTNQGIFISNITTPTKFNKLDLSNNRSFSNIAQDDKKNIFILINTILYIKKHNENTFQLFEPTKKLSIRSFLLKEDNFWIITNNELLSLNSNEKIKLLHKFPNNSLGKIVHHNNKLWITNHDGILCYDITTQKVNSINYNDGLLAKNLENSRIFLSSDKRLFIPTFNGLMSITPDKISFNDKSPKTIFNNFTGTIENPINLNKLNKIDNQLYTIDLPHNKNTFEISFSSTNLLKPLKNKFKYKLNNYDKNWTETHIPILKYSNLSPGEYEMQIFSSNNDEVWSYKPLVIKIKISPPFWQTWWAYIIYLCIIAFSLHLIIKFIVEREILLNSDREYQKKINFFSQISHEIRTPLTLITAPIDDILSATKEDSNINAKVWRLKNNANKLLSIVNELLDFKKIDANQEHLVLEEIEINYYLEEMFYLFTDLALAKQIQFYIKHIEDNAIVAIDRKQFDKVIFNLLNNAIKYASQNGTTFMQGEIKNGNYSIQFYNDGIGISEDSKFKIFDEYYRDKNADGSIGTGIGLALSKRIVTMHKGNISYNRVKINDIYYSEFTVEIPILTKKQTQNPKSPYIMIEPDELLKSKIESLDKELLLIVEDNIELNEIIKNTFDNQFNILQAYDGVQGYEMTTEHLPDIVITDLMMPTMSGIQMCEKIRNNMTTSHIPIIMLTANTNESSQIDSLALGTNIYMHKPFNPKVLKYTTINLLNISAIKRKQFTIEKNENLLSELDKRFIKKFEEIIDSNLQNPNLGVDYIAKEIGMSAPIIYKKLKAITNLSINNFVKQYRFNKALELLKSETNISQVAYQVGFSDRKYFSKEFKKHFGLNPTEYYKR